MKLLIEIEVSPGAEHKYCDGCKYLDIEQQVFCTLFCEPLSWDDETAIRRCELCLESKAKEA